MMRFKRPLVATGAAVVLGLSLSACGGGAPTDASEADFCEVSMDTSWFEDLSEGDYDGFVEAAKEHADELEEVGTPEGISDEAREGFEISIESGSDLDADTLKEAAESGDTEDPFESELSGDEQDKLEAFNTYVADTCAS